MSPLVPSSRRDQRERDACRVLVVERDELGHEVCARAALGAAEDEGQRLPVRRAEKGSKAPLPAVTPGKLKSGATLPGARPHDRCSALGGAGSPASIASSRWTRRPFWRRSFTMNHHWSASTARRTSPAARPATSAAVRSPIQSRAPAPGPATATQAARPPSTTLRAVARRRAWSSAGRSNGIRAFGRVRRSG
jgi:hypothetical protein